MPARQPASAHLAEALGWLVAHSQASPEGLTPGPLELAELLWLAKHLPKAPGHRSVGPLARPSTTLNRDRYSTATVARRQSQPSKQERPLESVSLAADPLLPTPFPSPAETAPQDTLLPVAVLPNDRDVARELEGMLRGRVRQERPLGDRDKLLCSLAPLLKRYPDPRRQRFAEEATVDLYAQTGGLLQPLYEPCRGPAFDEVLLLRDGGLSMQVWRRQADELRRVVASTQVFSRVQLREITPGPVQRHQTPAGRRRAVAQLVGEARVLPGSRSLLLVLSDTAGRHWWDGRMFVALETWARTCPTAILHPLPLWHWNRTALGAVDRVTVRNASPAATNLAYHADPLQWWDQPLPRSRDLAVPVLPLDPDELGTWSAVVMGHPSYATTGVALLTERLREQQLHQLLGDRDLAAPLLAPAPGTAEEASAILKVFQSIASAEAQKLLLAMASSPLLTLPVIDLIKAAKLPAVAGALPIAEVLSSGLVVRKQVPASALPQPGTSAAKAQRPEQIEFEVLPEVAALLRRQLSPQERRDVISRVSALVERRWNRQIGEPSFEAVLCDPTVAPPKGMEGVVQFAAVTARLLDTLPGEAARAFAERIRKGSRLPPGSLWPAAMAFKQEPFETAQLVETPALKLLTVTAARWQEFPLQPIAYPTLRPEDLDRFLREVDREGGEAARASLPKATAWAFHEPLRREGLAFGATATQPDPLALTLVEISAGSFQMGSPGKAAERFADEGPQHEVTLASFFISQTPITQAQWREVAGWQPLPAERWGRELDPEPSYFQPRRNPKTRGYRNGRFSLLPGEASSDLRPVENVSWEDAMEFCKRLSQRTGRSYSLPSEAQWEYACRAGSSTPFAFGKTLSPELANYDGKYTYANGPKGQYHKQTTPVGMFPANAWGLQDMHGNVWEWCQDHWHHNYKGAPTDGSPWLNAVAQDGQRSAQQQTDGTNDSEQRLLRGGYWYFTPGHCRSAYRYRSHPGYRADHVGFRVCCLPQDLFLYP